MLDRLKQHLGGKDFWTEAVVFISKDTNLNKAHIKFLEYHLYQLARRAKRYELLNANQPTESAISEMDRAELEEFIDNMRLLLSVLGHKVLEPVAEMAAESESDAGSPRPEDSAHLVLYLTDRSGVGASGVRTSEGFVVLEGSRFNPVMHPSLPQGIRVRRGLLAEEGLLDGDSVLRQDTLFTSPSAAAEAVVGYSINGWIAWRTADGRTLKEVETADQRRPALF